MITHCVYNPKVFVLIGQYRTPCCNYGYINEWLLIVLTRDSLEFFNNNKNIIIIPIIVITTNPVITSQSLHG